MKTIAFTGDQISDIFKKIRVHENIQTPTQPLTHLLGIEATKPNVILKRTSAFTYIYKVVDEKRFVFAKLKYEF